MVPDWLAALLVATSFSHGFILAWALCKQDTSTFWEGVVDGLTFRMFWERPDRTAARRRDAGAREFRRRWSMSDRSR